MSFIIKLKLLAYPQVLILFLANIEVVIEKSVKVFNEKIDGQLSRL